MSGFEDKLSRLKGKWAEAKGKERTFSKSEVPDGIYLARIVEAEIGDSQSSGRLQCAWKFEITEGEYEGEVLRKYDGLETEDNFFYFQNSLQRLGFDLPDDPKEISKILAHIVTVKPSIKIKVKTNGEFTNIYINKLMEEIEPVDILEKVEETVEAPAEVETEKSPEVDAPAEDSSEQIELSPGMSVGVSYRGDIIRGKILGFTANNEQVKLQLDTGKTVVAGMEDISLLENEVVAEKPAPPPPALKINKVRKLTP